MRNVQVARLVGVHGCATPFNQKTIFIPLNNKDPLQEMQTWKIFINICVSLTKEQCKITGWLQFMLRKFIILKNWE